MQTLIIQKSRFLPNKRSDTRPYDARKPVLSRRGKLLKKIVDKAESVSNKIIGRAQEVLSGGKIGIYFAGQTACALGAITVIHMAIPIANELLGGVTWTV